MIQINIAIMKFFISLALLLQLLSPLHARADDIDGLFLAAEKGNAIAVNPT
jgi:hypothetical protein